MPTYTPQQLASQEAYRKKIADTPGQERISTNVRPTGGAFPGASQQPAVAPEQPKTPTVSDIYGGLVTPEETALDSAYADYAKYNKELMQPVDENAIRQNTIAQFQAEIDALDKIYAEKKAEERVAGEGRLGQTAAISARSGILGSDFGAAHTAKTQDYNQQMQAALDAEKAAKIQAIYGKATEQAQQEIADKRAARQLGYTQYMDYLKGAADRTNQKLTSYADQLVYSGADINDTDINELAKQLGVSPTALKAQYNKAKTAKEASDQTTSYGKFETANKQAVSLAPLIIENLTGDPTNDQTVIKDFADKYGIDPNVLSSAVNQMSYERQYNEDKLLEQGQTSEQKNYNFYVQQEKKAGRVPVDFNTYQDIDANRKKVASGLTDSQKTSTFNGIVNQYSKSPLIAAKDRTVVLKQAISDVEREPENAGFQFNLSYSYIQALDTYQSAVREGELQNLNSIDSKIGSLKNWVDQMQNGQIVRPEIAVQIAAAAKQVLFAIESGAEQKDKMFASQAKVSGLELEWKQFKEGMGEGSLGDTENDPLGLGITSGNEDDPLNLTKESQTSLNGLGNIASNIDSEFKDGQIGGECGVFAHSLVNNLPRMGDKFTEKQKSVEKNGFLKDEWNPQIGDVVITDGSDVTRSGKPYVYGHAAVVAGIKQNGDLVLIESNAKGNKKITKGRTISKDNPAVFGALRGELKNKYIS